MAPPRVWSHATFSSAGCCGSPWMSADVLADGVPLGRLFLGSPVNEWLVSCPSMHDEYVSGCFSAVRWSAVSTTARVASTFHFI